MEGEACGSEDGSERRKSVSQALPSRGPSREASNVNG
jgi:hypothetical protein